jgi:hypothetical protein
MWEDDGICPSMRRTAHDMVESSRSLQFPSSVKVALDRLIVDHAAKARASELFRFLHPAIKSGCASGPKTVSIALSTDQRSGQFKRPFHSTELRFIESCEGKGRLAFLE